MGNLRDIIIKRTQETLRSSLSVIIEEAVDELNISDEVDEKVQEKIRSEVVDWEGSRGLEDGIEEAVDELNISDEVECVAGAAIKSLIANTVDSLVSDEIRSIENDLNDCSC